MSYKNADAYEETEKKTKFCYLKAFHQMKAAFNKLSKNHFDTLTRQQKNELGRVLSTYKTSANIRPRLAEAGLSEPEIESLLQSAAGESISWIDDPNERKQVFAQILSGGDRRRVLHLIRMLYVRRRELQKNGKHLRIADEQTLRDAEKLLNDEFAHVLHIPQQDVPDYIRSRMEREA